MTIQTVIAQVPGIAHQLCYTKGKGQIGIYGTFRTVMAFGLTCKAYYQMINQNIFCSSFKSLINKKYILPEENNSVTQGFCFRHFKYFKGWTQNTPKVNNENYSASMWGDTIATSKGLEFFKLCKPIQRFFLEKDSQKFTLEIPEKERVVQNRNRMKSLVSRSDAHIAINLKCDDAINIFCATTNAFLFKMMASGPIIEINFINGGLVVREKDEKNTKIHKLSFFNLQTQKKEKELVLPFQFGGSCDHFPLCFGETHVFGCDGFGKKFFLQALEGEADFIYGDAFSFCISEDLRAEATFSDRNGFIVVGKNEQNTFSICKVTLVGKTMQSKRIDEIKGLVESSSFIETVLYVRKKLFLVHSADIMSSPRITSYDVETKISMSYLVPILQPLTLGTFEYRLLSLDKTVYFTAMEMSRQGDAELKLIKIDYNDAPGQHAKPA